MDSSKPDLNLDHGFVSKPYARRKVIKNPDGSIQVIYEDVRTGKQVNPKGYTVIQSDNAIDSTNVQATQGESLAKKPEDANNKSLSQEIIRDHGPDSITPDTKSQAGESYYNKPGWMGYTSMIPGPIGLAAKLGNMGVNANNTAAVNDQRATLGFAPNPTSKNIGSTLFDQQGYIGDISTPKANGTVSTAPVSFEATDKNQRTAYTPEEARLHEIMAASKPATEQEQQAAIGSFNNQFPEANKSFFGGLVASAKDFTNNIFGSNPTPVTGSGVYTGSTNTSNTGGFPPAPTSTNSANNSPDDRDANNNGGYSHPGLF